MTDFITSHIVIQQVKSLYPFIEFDLKPEEGKPSRTKAIIGSSLCPSFVDRSLSWCLCITMRPYDGPYDQKQSRVLGTCQICFRSHVFAPFHNSNQALKRVQITPGRYLQSAMLEPILDVLSSQRIILASSSPRRSEILRKIVSS